MKNKWFGTFMMLALLIGLAPQTSEVHAGAIGMAVKMGSKARKIKTVKPPPVIRPIKNKVGPRVSESGQIVTGMPEKGMAKSLFNYQGKEKTFGKLTVTTGQNGKKLGEWSFKAPSKSPVQIKKEVWLKPSDRKAGVRRATGDEGALLKDGHPGTRSWTSTQRQSLTRGKNPKDIDWHHGNSVKNRPDLARMGDNVFPVFKPKHTALHQRLGSDTSSKMINRSELVKLEYDKALANLGKDNPITRTLAARLR